MFVDDTSYTRTIYFGSDTQCKFRHYEILQQTLISFVGNKNRSPRYLIKILNLNQMENHIKLFVRKDLFRKITDERFVNLTHVNARKREIIWDEEDLFMLLCKRIRENERFLTLVNLHNASNKELFDIIFPEQVDVGKKEPTTWKWLLS